MAAEIRHLPSAKQSAKILHCTKTVEKSASASGNLKVTHICFLREAVGITRVCVTEPSKRNSSVGCEDTFEQEIFELRAKIRKLQVK